MGWWSAFEHSEVAEDFSRIATSGFDSVRLFLSWEDFQPTPDSVDRGARRIITGKNSEYYYTPDHYETFLRVEVR